ncbi:hypothetical protein CU052_13360 [Vibrio harveyi]|nr:hypothetical protein CU052_13360 [Vibrio harveyi]
MAIYMVTYDLRSPGQNYQDLIHNIEKYTHCKAAKSCFLIDVGLTAGQLRDELKQFVDSNDVLVIARLQGNWSSWCLNDLCVQWLKSLDRTW